MSNTTRQRAAIADSQIKMPDESGAAAALTDTLAKTDQLFAAAAKSFRSMTEGNSQEFLRRSRQTGGQ